MSYESLDAQIEELAMYACNFSSEHYNSTDRAIAKAWLRTNKGDREHGWNYMRAFHCVKSNLIDPAAKDYKREFGSMTQGWTDMWPLEIRQRATTSVLDMWLEEYELGNLPTIK